MSTRDPLAMFLAAAAANPTRPAVIEHDRSWTYEALVELVQRFAHVIVAAGVEHPRVTISLEQGAQAYAAMLATLFAGGTYCPLNLAHPPAHRAKIIARFEPHVVITGTPSLLEGLAIPRKTKIVRCDQPLPRATLAAPAAPADLAYVIFTSGSTGEPKGVMVGRDGLGHYTRWAQEAMAVTPDDRWSQHPNIAFDLSVLDIYGALCSGAALVPLTPANAIDPALVIRDQRLTIWNSVPSVIDLMVRAGHVTAQMFGSLRLMTFCGEPLLWQHLDAIFKARPDLVVHNTYGPTEATVSCTLVRFDRTTHPDPSIPIPIGRAIANTQIHIVDDHMQPVPAAVAGEIYIGGVQVARGYLNQPELTAERFVKNPFDEGGRLYKTGDLGRRRADGMIEFLGRNDFQVKINGYRIELGDIEAMLAQIKGVQGIVVHVREDVPGDKRIVAYYTGKKAPDAQTLRQHAAENLPKYMVPGSYVKLEALPLTLNGKLDRKALPRPEPGVGAEPASQGARSTLDVRTQIRRFIEANFAHGQAFSDDSNLLQLGIVDSLGVRELVPFLEKTFTVAIDDALFFDERFATLTGLSEIISQLQQPL